MRKYISFTYKVAYNEINDIQNSVLKYSSLKENQFLKHFPSFLMLRHFHKRGHSSNIRQRRHNKAGIPPEIK